MTTTKPWKEIKTKLSPARRARIREEAKAEALALELKDLRERQGLTQATVAERAEMSQGELSRFEQRADHKTSSLRRYVEAVGGKLEVAAIVDGQRIVLENA